MKTCTKCKIEKDICLFSKHKSTKDGHQYQCKECLKEYRSLNKEKISNHAKEYQSLNKGKITNYAKEYRKTDKGRASSTNSNHKRRTLLKKGDVTTNEIIELRKSKKCYWCNRSLNKAKVHVDHYIPLSKGGEHTLDNLVVSCSKCNLVKNAKDPLEFANEVGRLC